MSTRRAVRGTARLAARLLAAGLAAVGLAGCVLDEAACPALVQCRAGYVWSWGACACVQPNPTDRRCRRTGCSGEICADQEVITTCTVVPATECYDRAPCERQRDGRCGFTATPELLACFEQAGLNAPEAKPSGDDDGG